jgi:hypothetical protein
MLQERVISSHLVGFRTLILPFQLHYWKINDSEEIKLRITLSLWLKARNFPTSMNR